MSVYTELTQQDLERFIQNFDLGDLVGFEGIASGVENTNYRIETTGGRFVLTLVESLPTSALPFFVRLLNQAHFHRLPTVELVPNCAGDCLQILKGKTALLAKEISGSAVRNPSLQQAQAIARFVAQFHLVFEQTPIGRENDRWHDWRAEKITALAGKLPDDQLQRVAQWNQDFLQMPFDTLPQGMVHGDLFRDNALFDGDQLNGVLDFYNACTAPLIWDVAICLNDWCVDFYNKQLKPEFTQAFLRAYQEVRPLSDKEKESLNAMRQLAAFRFYLSRSYDRVYPKQGNIVTIKPPEEFWWLLHVLG